MITNSSGPSAFIDHPPLLSSNVPAKSSSLYHSDERILTFRETRKKLLDSRIRPDKFTADSACPAELPKEPRRLPRVGAFFVMPRRHSFPPSSIVAYD